MARLDPAVEDADADALAGRAAEGPVARDALGPVDADRDALARPGGQTPGGKVGGLAHPLIVRASLRQEATELFDHAGLRLDAFGLQRPLEIGEHLGAEGRVGLGPGDELVEPAPRGRQLLRRLHPALGSRGKHPDQA